jgi:hypothetical protein
MSIPVLNNRIRIALKNNFFLQLDRYLKNDFQLETCLKTRTLKGAGIRTLDERKPRPFLGLYWCHEFWSKTIWPTDIWPTFDQSTKEGVSVDQTLVGKMFVGRMFFDQKALHLLLGYRAWQCSGSFLFVGFQQELLCTGKSY